MDSLQEFAAYIRTNKLDDVVEKEIQLFSAENNFLKSSDADSSQHFAYLRERLDELLNAVEEDKHISYIEQRLVAFKHYEDKVVNPSNVSLSDIVNALLLQKMALVEFIPGFCSDSVSGCNELTLKLDKIYFSIQNLVIKAFDELQIKTYERLEEAEHSYKDLFDNAHDLIHFINPDGTILHVNNSWKETLGYEFEDLKGKLIYDFIVNEEKESFKQYREEVIQSKTKDKEITITLIAKDKRKVVLEGFVSPKIVDGIPIYTRGIFRDISSRIKDEEKLKFFLSELSEREENLQNLITHAPDAIIVINSLGKITLWNPKAEEIFGWKEEEVLGKNLNETIVPEVYIQAHQNGMKRYLSTGEAHILNKTIEITAKNKADHEFLISLTISKSVQGGETTFISFSRDISQQKKDELELIRKKQELENSHRELEQYAWLTSHDLREPLRKILTFSDLILSRYPNELPDQVKSYTQKILDAGRKMGKLIEAILFYSSITVEKKLYQSIDLNEILQEVMNDLEVPINEENAVIQISPLHTIEAVPYQMKQLFQNLVSNSIKYKQPDITPLIEISSINNDAETILVSLKDNGRGFEMKDQQKVFQLFQRLHTGQSTEGTGVGLAICKKIVQNHSGDITVESTPGQGTTFKIILPIKQPLS